MKTCTKGLHEMTDENTIHTYSGSGFPVKKCRTCKNVRTRLWMAQKRADNATAEQQSRETRDKYVWMPPGFQFGTEAWMEHKNCTGVPVEVFFPERGQPVQPAKDVCAGCSVQVECLEYAVRSRQHDGVWGGMTATRRRAEYRALRRRFGLDAA